MNIAFIGLGNMVSSMAHNLIKGGHTLTLFNRTRNRAEELNALGARGCRDSRRIRRRRYLLIVI